tara:strand:- start:400 stop:573 length:174 start_codon:yes stop_codon:yes gene_type:complete
LAVALRVALAVALRVALAVALAVAAAAAGGVKMLRLRHSSLLPAEPLVRSAVRLRVE